MKEINECKIVQDLLQNYIEKLTNEETNKYIEEHLKNCENCKKVLENMQKDIQVNDLKRTKKEVKYIKKFSNKMKLLKAIIILIILVFIALTLRKFFIISKLSEKAENTINSNNFHRIVYSYNLGKYTKTEMFKLDDKYKIDITEVNDDGVINKAMYAKLEESPEKYVTNIYIETNNEKKVYLNQEIGISADPYNSLYTDNWFQLFIISMFATVEKTTFNGEECYYISNFETINSGSEGKYVNKNTGLPISTIAYEYKNTDGTSGRWPLAEYVYEFNTVTAKDFEEPDLSEYKIIE